MQTVSLCGSTGSIGQSACRILGQAQHLTCKTLIFGRNEAKAREQIALLRPSYAGCLEKETALRIKREFSFLKEVFYGEGLTEAASLPSDIFVSAVSGSAGTAFSFAALKGARRLALANKETLVMAGQIFMKEALQRGVSVYPVDSEHNALYQCLQGEERENVESLVLTASGGPFRGFGAEELARVTPAQALKHPTWSMGKKITIDSATMANKGLEIIEASCLFSFPEERIEVVVHPQSIIHSMVRMRDGSLKALLGEPDMRLPLAYAFDYPRRERYGWGHCDLTRLGPLTFEAPDEKAFPALPLARAALHGGGILPLVYNRVNEEAVKAFLAGKIPFTGIAGSIERYLGEYSGNNRIPGSVEEVEETDKEIYQRIRNDLELT
ncbi:1-deoxy-D-xylulose-5-phosphate reductoisomerase [Candidatus Mcinerneyibacteriota bacterium]|nr:1-deoxy-D-xylulose-5-phosphate reductoisomerase [Candidatus Mcinerneyibacteriota bacterium]